MPPNIHGNFDYVVELDEDFITRIALLQLKIKTEKQPIGQDPNKDDMTGEAMISPSLKRIWFEIDEEKSISIRLDLGEGLIRIKTVLIRDKWPHIVMQIPKPHGDIKIQGYIDIKDRVEEITADAILDRAKPNEKTSSLCAVINFNKDNPYPKIDIQINKELAQDANIIKTYLLQARLLGFKLHDGTQIPPGDAAVEAARNQLFDDICGKINDAVINTLKNTTSWQLNLPGVVPLKIEPVDSKNPPEPLGSTALTVRTLAGSLLLLFRTIGPGGNPALITSSQIIKHSLPRASMGITIPHMTLIGGVVRRSIINSFTGLSQDSFLQDQPCILASSTRVTPVVEQGEPTPESFNLTSLIALVDESSQIRIGGSIGDSYMNGAVTWTASFEIIIKLDAEVKVSDGIPKLVITSTVVSSKVTKSDISVAWWAWAIAAVIGYVNLLPMIIAAGPIVIEGKVNENLSKIKDDLGPPKSIDIPGATKLNVVNTSLHDEDAPPRTLSIGPIQIYIGRDHDLSIVLDSADYCMNPPCSLKVSCIIPDDFDSDRRIDAVGGILPDGTPWGMSIDEAIAAIESGKIKMVVGDPPNEAEVEVITPSGHLPYLRTHPGKGPNLLNQSRCPRLPRLL